jgi:glyoxylase-like metal-dependent hydrolase (beta-lactamase superfamily II)
MNPRSWLCPTCGTAFPPSEAPPSSCLTCEDYRQFVDPRGQKWVQPEEISTAHRIGVRRYERNLYGLGMEPAFGIGQRALLLRTDHGNILWDCIPLIDQCVADLVNGLGGLVAVAISHPHFHSAMVKWSEAFGDVPIYIHELNRPFVAWPDSRIRFWSGDELTPLPGVRMLRAGRHFEGSALLHFVSSEDGKGVVLSGDTIRVLAGRSWVSFMRSYPNELPLSENLIRQIGRCQASLEFDRIYGAFWDEMIVRDAKQSVEKSLDRYLKALSGAYPADKSA